MGIVFGTGPSAKGGSTPVPLIFLPKLFSRVTSVKLSQTEMGIHRSDPGTPGSDKKYCDLD